jgi:hypothetical protein
MPFRRKNAIIAISVPRLPRPRIFDMTSERLDLVKTSGMGSRAEFGGKFQAAFGFLGRVPRHAVVKAGPLGIGRIKLPAGGSKQV